VELGVTVISPTVSGCRFSGLVAGRSKDVLIIAICVTNGHITVSIESIAGSCRTVVNELFGLNGKYYIITSGCTVVLELAVRIAHLNVVVVTRLTLCISTFFSRTGCGFFTGSFAHNVLKSCNRLRCRGKLLVTNGTVNYLVVRAFNAALGLNSVFLNGSAGNTICKLAGGRAALLTGCKNKTGCICVVVSKYFLVLVTVLTGPLLAANSIIGSGMYKSSTLCGNGVGSAAAVGTSSSLGTVNAAGCILVVAVFAPVMRDLLDRLAGAPYSFTAELTLVLGNDATFCSTRGLVSGYDRSSTLFVTGCLENFSLGEPCLTVVAVLACGKTVFSTSGLFLIVLGGVLVTGSRNLFLNYGNSTTNSTFLTFLKTVFGTGRCLSGKSFLAVRYHRKNFLLNSNSAANSTLLTVGKTGVGTRSCLAGNGFLGVSCLRNSFLRCGYGLTRGALNALGKTGFGTGGSLSRKNDVVLVAERCALCFITY